VKILGLESSCDETSVAVVEDGRRVLGSVVASQVDLHRKYGGVVPELASRAHVECMIPVLEEALAAAQCRVDDVDAVAVVHTPGLIGSLLMGVTAAKTLAWLLRKPLIPVNHIEAHAYSVCLDTDVQPWPCVSLIVSGGHTSLFHSQGPLEHRLVGRTRDDAAGEAFDKVAAILELPYPGGPNIDRLARQGGNAKAIRFKRTSVGDEGTDFSFSGIKTAVLYHVRGTDLVRTARDLTAEQVADVAASFQEAVVDMLVKATLRAADSCGASTIILGGGVAANSRLRGKLVEAATAEGLTCHIPPLKYCTDNAGMVAGLGYHLFRAGRTTALDLAAMA
jgi:N6-L-threonylcarbamoyladenine synthase